MDGNKDEALRCVKIAEAALASGDKQRALKFIKIAQRLDSSLQVNEILAACQNQDSSPSSSSFDEKIAEQNLKESIPRKIPESPCGTQNYTEEHIKVVRDIKRQKDYYAILGVERSCSVEEIRKAYRKLSLKVHPDKNKAPGSEEAFKMVSKAFKCLSEEGSRSQYDQTGLVEEFEYNQQHNFRRRRRPQSDLFDENFDPDEIFRSFFFGGSQPDVFRRAHVYRTRGMGTQHRENVQGGFNVLALLQLLPILIIFLLAYLPFSEPDYSLQKTYSHQIPKVTEKFGVEFYVKSQDFDVQFPQGSPSRANLERNVMRDYKSILGRYCHMELQRRQWARNYPTPHCDKLQNLAAA
ncbi:chaperone protein dnaJ 49-like [Aristolochia californica]|uniref:chaperone protein dnaJ 49-like n=1 Tax=Aristolochia californica TaxID=171875 RepID=UPI0035DBE8E1